jgi:hypothetical protein
MVLALVFTIVWIARPNLRRRIEAPKHDFLRQVQRYNRQVGDKRDDKNGVRQ